MQISETINPKAPGVRQDASTTLFPANLGGSACCSEICSADNFGGSAFRRPFGHDSTCGLSKLVALLPNFMQIVHNWSEKGVMLCDLT